MSIGETPDSFLPPARTLMGPGPSDVPARVLSAMSRPTVGHLDPAFGRMMEEVKDLLRYAFRTRNELTIPISAPGSAGMEACFVNLVGPGDEVVVCRNGVFGDRMRENVERVGGTPILVDDTWGKPVSPEGLEAALTAHPGARTVAFVQAETSTGASSDVERLAGIAHAHDALVIVDAVTSLGGTPLAVDDWDVDAAYAGVQKCLSCPPGLSPLTFGPRAVARMQQRKTKVQSWFLDLGLQMDYWSQEGGRTYHHTAPVNALYALHEALRLLHDEGLERAWERHARNHRILRAGLEAMGLTFVVAEAARLPQLNAVTVPAGVDDAGVRLRLLEQHGLEIGAGLGPLAGKVWRIGLMGHSSRVGNVLRCLESLDEVLRDVGAPIAHGAAVPAARAARDADAT